MGESHRQFSQRQNVTILQLWVLVHSMDTVAFMHVVYRTLLYEPRVTIRGRKQDAADVAASMLNDGV